MNLIFKCEIIDYEFKNNHKKHTILFLHGWGGNKNSFLATANLLSKNFNILTLTMPTVQNTILAWTLFDYAQLVLKILELNKVKKIIIVCHSFGFRVACLINGKIKIERIVITGGAGITRQNIFKKIETCNNLIQIKNNPALFEKIASEDYKNLSTTNKITFKNIVNQNLIYCSKFSCPVLLFWGKYDTATPLWIAKKLEKQNNAKLVSTKSDHFAYLKQSALFNFEVVKFLNDIHS